MAEQRPLARAGWIVAGILATAALTWATTGCGGSEDSGTTGASGTTGTTGASEKTGATGAAETTGATASSSSPTSELSAATLTSSFSKAAVGFGSRRGSVLRLSVSRSLGKGAAIAMKPESADCRPASATPADSAPARFPFACIVSGTAASGGVSTTFTLGFVVFGIRGRCWRAANERIAAAKSGPVLIPKQRAMQPANVIAGCANA